MSQTKVCTKCGEEKGLEGFYKAKAGKFGVTARCKGCVCQRNKEWHEANREKVAQRNKEHYEANREAIAQRKKEYYEANREAIAQRKKEWYEANREAVIQRNKEYLRKRYHSDPEFRMGQIFSSQIYQMTKSQGGSKKGSINKKWCKILGYTKKQLCDHLEKQFTPEMSWDNQGGVAH